MKLFARSALISAFFVMLLGTGALAVSVEQTQLCMPEIDVYLYEDGNDLSEVTADDITATLDGEPLGVRDFGKGEQGIFYVYMLDVSASIPEAHFSAAKAAVLNAWTRLRSQDRLALITFGNEVTMLLKGGESGTQVTETIDALHNSDKNTKFYNAMDALIELVVNTEDMRRVAVVISDGIDDTDAGMTQQELEEKLVRTGVSVSAMCIDTTSAQSIQKFTDFIRLSGGELYVFGPDNAETVLDTLLDRLDGGWLLSLEAPTNMASGKEAQLAINFGGVSSVTLAVTPERWTPDVKRPRVKSVEYDQALNAFIVTFSEAVTGAGDAANYVLTDGNGGTAEIRAAEAVEDTVCRLRLAAQPPENTTLTLGIGGISDVSMEQNALYQYSEIVWSGTAAAEPAAAAAPGTAEEPILGKSTILIIGIIMVLAAAAVTAILKLSIKKTVNYKGKQSKNKKENKKESKTDATKSTAKFMFLNEDEDGNDRQ